MKPSRLMFTARPLMRKLGLFLGATATVAVLAVAASGLLMPVRGQATNPADPQAPPQAAQVQQLLANFHGALSYGGDLTAMASLWADNSSLTLNGTAYSGKDAVLSFFANGAYFNNDWVSLAPEYKTQIVINGDTATATTQCVGVDLSVTPHVVRSVIQVNATAVFQNGRWLFTSMNNTSGAPL
jgi:SnoaL-like domain